MKGKKIYLAIPYSGIEEKSFKAVNEVAAHFLRQGDIVYSPISQGHAIVQENSLPHTREFWAKIEREFIPWCDELIVVVLLNDNGSERITKSEGCQSEIALAKTLGKQIDFYMYGT